VRRVKIKMDRGADANDDAAIGIGSLIIFIAMILVAGIDQLAIIIRTTAGSDKVDLTYTYISLSNASKQVILNYSSAVFSDNVSNGLFDTLNSSLLTSTTYGLMIIRDIDNSCTMTYPTINNDDMVVLLVNATQCFSGIPPRTKISGNIVPEYGISALVSFTTPSVYIDKIIELQ
jgi:flagellin FlaB